MEVGIASVGLPTIFTAVGAASEHSDGVQRIGFAVVVADPCSTREAREKSISYWMGQLIRWSLRRFDVSRRKKGVGKEKVGRKRKENKEWRAQVWR